MSRDLRSAEPEPPGVDPMVRCATEAVAVVGDAMAALSGEHGRAGMMICLRLRSQELSRSALAEDQVRSRAFEAAADDVAWGRKPLQAWLRTMSEPAAASEEQRAAIRATLPAPGCDGDGPTRAEAHALVREIEARWARSGDDAFQATRRRDAYLAAVRDLAGAGLRRPSPARDTGPARRDALQRPSAGRPGPPPASANGGGSPALAVPGFRWPKLLRWRRWLGST